jgi:hypothetical protein
MVETILVGFGIEKYSTIIFLGIEECKKTKKILCFTVVIVT